MAKELKRRGFVFVGPTTAYAIDAGRGARQRPPRGLRISVAHVDANAGFPFAATGRSGPLMTGDGLPHAPRCRTAVDETARRGITSRAPTTCSSTASSASPSTRGTSPSASSRRR